MADPFVAEIRIFAFQFAPKGWAQCLGQLLPISQNTALFSLIGTFYGGDGKSTFALPNLQGSAALHAGQGPGLSQYDLGQTGGSETVTLLTSEMPAHGHALNSLAPFGNRTTPVGNTIARVSGATPYLPPANAVLAPMAPEALAPAGGDQPHNNMMPYLTLMFCIALQGVFPPRP
jgi:microcystin-dependent protein